jgi:hypothetical protein
MRVWSSLAFKIIAASIGATAMIAGPAQAELGGAASGIAREGVQMSARLATREGPGQRTYQMTLPNGGAVRQFANPAGRVYAVTWSGPGKPDLRALLGDHFSALQSSRVVADPRFRDTPTIVRQADLVITANGHMGYFWGVAYVPSLAPQGFSPADLK